MEGAILSVSNNNNRFRNHLKNAASALCAKTLPKPRRNDASGGSSAKHHTYPRAAPPKRASIPCRMEPLILNSTQHPVFEPPAPDRDPLHYDLVHPQMPNKQNEVLIPKGALAK